MLSHLTTAEFIARADQLVMEASHRDAGYFMQRAEMAHNASVRAYYLSMAVDAQERQARLFAGYAARNGLSS